MGRRGRCMQRHHVIEAHGSRVGGERRAVYRVLAPRTADGDRWRLPRVDPRDGHVVGGGGKRGQFRAGYVRAEGEGGGDHIDGTSKRMRVVVGGITWHLGSIVNYIPPVLYIRCSARTDPHCVVGVSPNVDGRGGLIRSHSDLTTTGVSIRAVLIEEGVAGLPARAVPLFSTRPVSRHRTERIRTGFR